MFEGADNGGLIPGLYPRRPPKPYARRWWASLPFRVSLTALALACAYGLALAMPGQPSDCSGTVGVTAAPVVFPKAGAKGPPLPSQWVFIVNPSATATLWISIAPGGTAAANAAGSFPLLGAGNSVTLSDPAPVGISIIATAGSTPYTCAFQ